MSSRIPHALTTLVAVAGALAPLRAGAAGETTATYELVFNATWSPDTHPLDFPGGPHFSGLIGGTHDVRVHFWRPGGIASQGIEDMAERGRKSPLDAEINAAIAVGEAEFLVSGGNIAFSPGSRSHTFQVTSSHPLVTIVSMIAPSPDWFVGVDALPLSADGVWLPEVVVELAPFDAGTDSGISYESPDDDTDPHEPIRDLSDEYPFQGTPPLGTFTFTLVSVDGCAADFNDDGVSDTRDVLDFLNAWTAAEPAADINADGAINTLDVLAFLDLWNTGCV
ncbi:MAG TPA: spondin domain-containing protein [Phycisphaerales bacterium]|nr:spondin domain-containing protein [Phycisphaerales bacterium]